MFDRIKKVFAKETKEQGRLPAPVLQSPYGVVSEWAAMQGLGFSLDSTGQGMSLQGKVMGKPWQLQLGSPSRRYIRGVEIRARAELGLDEDVAALVMNRPLKEALEKQAYQMYTDSLQTSADPGLPEEMRWLAMFDEVGWESLSRTFWHRYSVLTDRRENALGWIDPTLSQLMLDWPEPAPSREVPFIVMLLRGKAYLRMEYRPAEPATLQHAAAIFISACESAVNGLPVPSSS
jgi:hypothetical protein